MTDFQHNQWVKILVDGEERRGRVVEIQYASIAPDLFGRVGPPSAIRVWLDGDVQPEQTLRPTKDVRP